MSIFKYTSFAGKILGGAFWQISDPFEMQNLVFDVFVQTD